MSHRPAKRRLADSERAQPESLSEPARASTVTPAAAAAVVAPVATVVADAAPKVIMSRAQRRKLKKPPVIVTAEMKERAREEKRELRKYLRMVKSNGARRKVAKLREKRHREENENEEAFNPLFRATKKGRRLE